MMTFFLTVSHTLEVDEGMLMKIPSQRAYKFRFVGSCYKGLFIYCSKDDDESAESPSTIISEHNVLVVVDHRIDICPGIRQFGTVHGRRQDSNFLRPT